ncbi:MAG: VPLPA-CTERM sorting domain-containing protein [Spongiibacteraceae bacterium]
MKKSLLALALSVAAVSGAHASWFSGVPTSGDSSIGNGELVLVAWDDVAKTSYAQDLGIRFDDLKAGTVNTSIALNSALFSQAFSGNTSNVQWVLGAASNHWSNADQSAYETLNFGLFSSGRATSVPGQTDGQSQLDITQGYFQTYGALPALMGGAMQTGTVTDNGAIATTAGAANYLYSGWAQNYVLGLPGGMGVSSAVGQTTNLWFFGFADNELQSPITEIRGTATLANGSLTIAQSTTPTVPVPAAAWLMGSALLGLGGVARSRKNA